MSSSSAMTAANRSLLHSYITLLVGIAFYASAAQAGPIVVRDPTPEANPAPNPMAEVMLEQRSFGSVMGKIVSTVTSCEVM